MNKEIEIPEGYEARIEGNKVIIEKKESEDEKIRKEIMEYLTITRETDLVAHPERQRWIAYLEKQKEPLTPEEKMNHPLYLEGFDVGKKVGEVLKEQKPAEWSEEDEQWLEAIIKDYENSLTKDKDHAAVIKIEIDFLKSLPERFSPQPHWKPSKEQMKALEDAFRKDGGNEYRKVINSLYCDLQKLL